MHEPMSAEVLRAAAGMPHPPARLMRAADAVLEGEFTWEDVASGTCEHPRARALYSPKAKETVWPALCQVADELNARSGTAGEEQPSEDDNQPHPRTLFFDEEDFSTWTYMEDWDY
jgi:hypothetical protein